MIVVVASLRLMVLGQRLANSGLDQNHKPTRPSGVVARIAFSVRNPFSPVVAQGESSERSRRNDFRREKDKLIRKAEGRITTTGVETHKWNSY